MGNLRKAFICIFVAAFFLALTAAGQADEDYMTDSGEIEEVSDGDIMTDSGEIEEVGDDGSYMTDSGEIGEVSED